MVSKVPPDPSARTDHGVVDLDPLAAGRGVNAKEISLCPGYMVS